MFNKKSNQEIKNLKNLVDTIKNKYNGTASLLSMALDEISALKSLIENMRFEYESKYADNKPLDSLTIKVNSKLKFSAIHTGSKLVVDKCVLAEDLEGKIKNAVSESVKHTNNLIVEIDMDYNFKSLHAGSEINVI